jgi:hypothetical protein
VRSWVDISLTGIALQGLFTGLYTEATVAEALRHLAAALREAMRKPPTEALLLDHYARLCLVVDEVVHEVRQHDLECT